jgi:CheY-like chemotaxis protein
METKVKIFIVDDDEDVLDQLTMILESDGYEVHSATSQAAGEEMLLSIRPQLAIMDVMMEQMDSGFVLCHYLKKIYPDVPVVLLTAVTAATGLSFSSTSAEARKWTKADEILDKPVRSEQVRNVVEKLLGGGMRKSHAAEHKAH